MKRKVLLIPLIIFTAIAAALLWQLARNAEGDDPTNLESALIGKPVPKFRLESLDNPGQFYQADVLTQGKPVLLNVWATVSDLPCGTSISESAFCAGHPRGRHEL